ncbi:Ig-like domain-containing protein, partial [Roseivirga echinicomitans]
METPLTKSISLSLHIRGLLIILVLATSATLNAQAIDAQFSATPTESCSNPQIVSFTDQSVNPDTWSWNFGDGGTSRVKNPSHTYTTTGDFTVRLTVQDTIFGSTDTYTEIVSISVATADFTGTSLFGCGPLTTNFTDASSISGTNTIAGWAWDFGDGSTSTAQNPSHVYDKPGTYTVKLKITDSGGCTHEKTRTNYVQVIGPEVKFSTIGTTILGGPGAITFQNQSTSTSPIINWGWNFGDGSTFNLQNPTHTYTTSGTFDVSLTVSDLDGCSRTLTKTNYVNTISGAFDISKAIFEGNEDRFSVAAQENQPRSMAFNLDGTKLYVMGSSGDDINEYNLSVAYDVTSAVYAGDAEGFSVAAQEVVPRSFAFNNDGSKMFVIGTIGDDVNEYNLSTAFDVSTAVFAGDAERFSVAAQETNPTSLTFNLDGTKMYVAGSDNDAVNEYILSEAFDVSSATYSKRLLVGTQELFPQSIVFVNNGLNLLVMGSSGDDINQYTLTTAFDLSTATFAGNAARFSVASQDGQPNSVTFSSDGTKMFVMGSDGDDINQYSLAAPVITGAVANQAVNDIETISPFSNITVADPNGDNVSATITLGDNAKGVLTGAGLTGSGPYTLASTDAASLQVSLRALVFNPSDKRVAFGTTETTTFSLVISDGSLSDTDNITSVVSTSVILFATSIEVSGSPVNSANTVDFILKFNIPVTGVDLSDFILDKSAGVTANLASISGSGDTYTLTVDGISGHGIVSIDLKDAGTGIVSGATSISEGFTNGAYHEVGDAFDISKAIFTGNHERFSVASQETSPYSLAFNNDGSKMFVMGNIGVDINEYTLSTAFDVSTAVYAGDAERFSVASQDTSPRSLAFNKDGTKMFVMGVSGDDINEYTLSTGFDVSTATYAGDAERFSVSAQETIPNSFAFNNDGTKMFVTGTTGDDINEYTLSTGFDVSTAVYAGDAERFSIASQEYAPYSLAFNNDGSKMFVMGNNINEYHLSVSWDVSTATYAGNAERFSVSAQETALTSLAFNTDGTKMFVMGFDGDDINQYSLAAPVITGALANQAVNDNATISPFSAITIADPNGDNVSATITLDDNAKGVLTGTGLTGSGPYTLASTDAASLQAALRALVFNPTDSRVAAGSTETTTFSLAVSDGALTDTDNITSVVSTSQAVVVESIVLSGSPNNAALTVDYIISFNKQVTGADLSDFILDKSAGVTANLASINGSGDTYTLTVDGISGHGIVSIDLKDSGTGIVSGATSISEGFTNGAYHEVGDAFDISKAIFTGDHERFSVASQEITPRSLAFNNDGTKMFVLGSNGDDINEYTLSTAFDVSTAIYAGDAERFSVASQDTNPYSLAFNYDGTKMFVMGSSGDDINEYTLSTGFDVSTAVYAGDGERFSVAGQEIYPLSLAFNRDGTKMFIMGVDGNDINEYHLTTVWDVSTANYAGDAERFSVAGQELQPHSLAFNVEGTKMFVLGWDGDDINEYALATAWDVSTATYAGDVERFSVAGQETSSESLTFSADGTKMYVMGQGGEDINEYSLAAPVVTGATANQAVNDNSTLSPFSNITVADPNGDDVSATITLDDNAKGVLTGAGLTGSGPYTLASTDAASLQAVLRALVFNPTDNRVSIGNTEITTITIVTSDGTFNDTDSRTTVVSSPVASTVVLSSLATSPANTFTITATFSDPVTGFDASDFTISNGTAGAVTAVSTTVYTSLITPTTDGAVTVDVNAGVAQDAGGADNTSATQFSITADLTSPTVTITSAAADPINGAFTTIFTFSEAVTGLSIGDVTVVNGTASAFNVSSATIYTALITPTTDGAITVDVAANVAQDAATNGNTVATQFSITADLTDPTVVISSTTANPINGAFTMTFTFSEAVTGFAIGDITVGNGTASAFNATSATVYTALITPTTDGAVTVDVAANVAQDAATNGNTAATQFSVNADFTSPTVTITSAAADPINGAFTTTFTFSEAVSGFAIGDVTLVNGTASAFSATSVTVYTALITPINDGAVTVDVAANVAQDAATNGNTATTQFSINADLTSPTVVISST